MDLASNKSTLLKSLGAVSDKEWKSLREGLDTNEDGRMDQKEFDDALKTLDVNRDGKVDATDVAALGGREAALQRMMAFNHHSSDR